MLRSSRWLVILNRSNCWVLRFKVLVLIWKEFWRSFVVRHPFMDFVHHLFERIRFSIDVLSTECFRHLWFENLWLLLFVRSRCFRHFIWKLFGQQIIDLGLLFLNNLIKILFFLSDSSLNRTCCLILPLVLGHSLGLLFHCWVLFVNVWKVIIDTDPTFNINLLWILTKRNSFTIIRTERTIYLLAMLMVNIVIELIMKPEFIESSLLATASQAQVMVHIIKCCHEEISADVPFFILFHLYFVRVHRSIKRAVWWEAGLLILVLFELHVSSQVLNIHVRVFNMFLPLVLVWSALVHQKNAIWSNVFEFW